MAREDVTQKASRASDDPFRSRPTIFRLWTYNETSAGQETVFVRYRVYVCHAAGLLQRFRLCTNEKIVSQKPQKVKLFGLTVLSMGFLATLDASQPQRHQWGI